MDAKKDYQLICNHIHNYEEEKEKENLNILLDNFFYNFHKSKIKLLNGFEEEFEDIWMSSLGNDFFWTDKCLYLKCTEKCIKKMDKSSKIKESKGCLQIQCFADGVLSNPLKRLEIEINLILPNDNDSKLIFRDKFISDKFLNGAKYELPFKQILKNVEIPPAASKEAYCHFIRFNVCLIVFDSNTNTNTNWIFKFESNSIPIAVQTNSKQSRLHEPALFWWAAVMSSCTNDKMSILNNLSVREVLEQSLPWSVLKEHLSSFTRARTNRFLFNTEEVYLRYRIMEHGHDKIKFSNLLSTSNELKRSHNKNFVGWFNWFYDNCHLFNNNKLDFDYLWKEGFMCFMSTEGAKNILIDIKKKLNLTDTAILHLSQSKSEVLVLSCLHNDKVCHRRVAVEDLKTLKMSLSMYLQTGSNKRINKFLALTNNGHAMAHEKVDLFSKLSEVMKPIESDDEPHSHYESTLWVQEGVNERTEVSSNKQENSYCHNCHCNDCASRRIRSGLSDNIWSPSQDSNHLPFELTDLDELLDDVKLLDAAVFPELDEEYRAFLK